MEQGRADGFRHDINALRAIAVVAVLLFHFQVPGFQGGFVGVDVFFVISGYLMTSIIVTGLQQPQGFSLWRFYLARARRILPALAVLIITLLVIGWWALPQADYRTLAAQSVYALLFFSNIRFQRDAGYFEAASHENWLLHTWSLSVEWQFYLLLPLLIMVIWHLHKSLNIRRHKGNRQYKGNSQHKGTGQHNGNSQLARKPPLPSHHLLLPVLGICLLLSLARSIWLADNNPEAAFFLLESRAWQMLTGAMVFLLSTYALAQTLQNHSRLFTAAGLSLIIITMMLASSTTPWPGITAIAPVLGTALILMSARQSAWMRLPLVHYLGLSSYSLYLWHWPVFAALVYLGLPGSLLATVTGLALSLVLGAASWHLVEKPARRAISSQHKGHSTGVMAAGFLLVITLAGIIYSQQGIPGRLASAAEQAAAEAQNVDPKREQCLGNSGFDFPWCTYGGADIQAIVIGDSHANTVVTAVLNAVQQSGGGMLNNSPNNNTGNDSGSSTDNKPGVIATSYNACPTLFRAQARDNSAECKAFNDFITARLESQPAHIPLIIVNRSSVYPLGSQLRGEDNFRQALIRYPQQPAGEFMQNYRDDLIATTCQLAEHRPVYLLRPIPEMDVNVPRAMARRHLLNRPGEISISRAAYDRRHAAVWQAQDDAAARCGAELLDPTPYLCDSEHCYGSDNGRPLYYDEDHLSEFGNRKLVPLFRL